MSHWANTTGHAMIHNMSNHMHQWAHDMNQSVHNMSHQIANYDINTRLTGMHANSNTMLAQLEKMLNDVMRHNLSGIQNVVLPEWNRTFPADCHRALNKTKISYTLNKMRKGCPFYRGQIKHWAHQ